MMKKKILGVLMGIMILAGALVPVSTFAEETPSEEGTSSSCGSVKLFGLDPWYAGLTCTNGELDQSNFQTECGESGSCLSKSILKIIATVVKDLLFLAGFVAVVLLIVGGVKYMLSAGDPSAVAKATKTISGAITGLIISICAYAVVTFILSYINPS